MAVLYGPRDLKNRALPDGWDGAELEKLRTETDITIEQIATLVGGGIAALNAELLADPFYSMLFSVTTGATVEYRDGTSNEWKVHTEYGPSDEQRGDVQGHMLPIIPYDYGLGWTWDYLQQARRSNIEADIQAMLDAGRDNFQKALLDRFFQSADDSGAAKGLGSSGYSPGFCHAAASTSVDYVPPPYEGQTFDSDHEHYDATNSTAAADWETAIEAMARDLAEHGHMPPYVGICAVEDQGTIEGLTNFKERALPQIQYGTGVDLARVEDVYFGIVTTPDGATLWKATHRVPQYSMGMFKHYGNRNPRNPLAVRYLDVWGLVYTPLQDKSYRHWPIEGLVGYGKWGVGVGRERTNGVCHQMNTASYSDPTIT